MESMIRSTAWWRHQMDTFSALLAFCAGIHRSPVNSPHKGQWRGALMFSLICAWTNSWENNGNASDFRCHRSHDHVIVMQDVANDYNRSQVFLRCNVYDISIDNIASWWRIYAFGGVINDSDNNFHLSRTHANLTSIIASSIFTVTMFTTCNSCHYSFCLVNYFTWQVCMTNPKI